MLKGLRRPFLADDQSIAAHRARQSVQAHGNRPYAELLPLYTQKKVTLVLCSTHLQVWVVGHQDSHEVLWGERRHNGIEGLRSLLLESLLDGAVHRGLSVSCGGTL